MVNTDLIREFEGCRLQAYQDSVGVWTIGWGHTGPEVHSGLVWTQKQADDQLESDVNSFAIEVQNLLNHSATQGQYDAMVSFAYNLGINAFRKSILLQKFNSHDIIGAARDIGEYTHAGGQIMEGLVRRRVAEIVRFMS